MIPTRPHPMTLTRLLPLALVALALGCNSQHSKADVERGRQGLLAAADVGLRVAGAATDREHQGEEHEDAAQGHGNLQREPPSPNRKRRDSFRP